ncbi:MAG: hypothetical protein ACKODX_13740 [Gemmata sp.]
MARHRHTAPAWPAATNPDALLHLLWPRPPAHQPARAEADLPAPLARRLRLFGCACARMVWGLLGTDARTAVALSERYAAGAATRATLHAAAVRMVYGPVTFRQQASNAAGWASAGQLTAGQSWAYAPRELVWNPAEAAREAAKALATRAAGPAPPGGNPVAGEWQAAWNRAFAEARGHQAELLRDVFPPPGVPVRFAAAWRTDTVVALAREVDATGDYAAVPILADALQDAGCDSPVMLERCRTPSGVHCRGNWVVDLVLGRE